VDGRARRDAGKACTTQATHMRGILLTLALLPFAGIVFLWRAGLHHPLSVTARQPLGGHPSRQAPTAPQGKPAPVLLAS